MARGHAIEPLPVVSFKKVESDASTQPSGVHDSQARSYGYNDLSDFIRPENYIRYIEPLEHDLATQVEYDMDEQDQEWLDAVNEERRKDEVGKVSYETFEIIMDRLEKEWFNLTKHLPKQDTFSMPSEDSTCAICDDSEGENSNAIVFCDGCNLAVHQDCYGVPYIPEGQWLCRKCTVSPENPVSCELCPNEGGAFKQTVGGDWVHLLCAIWIPETRVANEVFMEPVTDIEKVPKNRMKLRCYICEVRQGGCIQCAKSSCFTAFHTTCARQQKLLLPMKSTQGSDPVTLTAFCDRHLPEEQQMIREAALEKQEAEEAEAAKQLSSKSARAYAKTYKPGPPLVPAIVGEHILRYIRKLRIRRPVEFVNLVCRYWSLKREARRGAPLLKRLHLEPWTASNKSQSETEEEKMMKLEQLQLLRDDLELLRSLTELTRKRESRKLRQAEIIQGVLSQSLFYHEPALRTAFGKIVYMDKGEYFKNPVSRHTVPDYFDIVKNPMSWNNIEKKLDNHEYWDLQTFRDDIELVLDNALLYNKPNTKFHRTAQRIRTAIPPIFADLERVATVHNIDPDAIVTVGNFEPPQDVLDMLVSTDAIAEELPIILPSDPITSLLNYEMPVRKPSPPPPPPKIKVPKSRKRKNGGMTAADGQAESSGPTDIGTELAGLEGRKPQSSDGRMDIVEEGPSSAPIASPASQSPLDDKDTFKLFDVGWILPEDARRRGRAPPPASTSSDRGSLPPPKKRAKAGKSSALSVFSTEESQNQTLAPSVYTEAPTEPSLSASSNDVGLEASMNMLALDPPQSDERAADIVMEDLSTSENIPPRISSDRLPSPAIQLPPEEPPSTSATELVPEPVAPTPRQTIIIEELDTPATRREKYLKRKKLREGQQLAISSKTTDASSAQEDSAATSDREKGKERDSEMSELTESQAGEGDGEAEDDGGKTSPPPGIVNPDDNLDTGTLVWAKMPSYPWWPATVYKPGDPQVPNPVLQQVKLQKSKGKSKKKDKRILVQFFDRAKSWNAIATDNILLLHKDTALDGDLLAAVSSRQKWKSAKIRAECNTAYEEAMEVYRRRERRGR